ncbi:MAG: copper chaperone PCu(A)C [Lysobacter sp.]|nr:copper chaperone PCu(A)C [Lysobacter sp.]MDQ3269548.1 copper chaperone PCu(A)C [Pseudomonadota bacterium]
MTPVRAAVAACLASICLASLASCSRDCTASVEDGWLRWLPVETPVTAGYVRIDNPCGMPLTVIGTSSPDFSDVSLHETRVEAGISRMRAVAELRVPAGASVQLQSGGLHLMMSGPIRPLTPGRTVRIDFALSDGRTLSGDVFVRPALP